MRLVIDTNVLIRGMYSNGPARQFLRRVAANHVVIHHPEQFAELRRVAARPRLKIDPEFVEALIDGMTLHGQALTGALAEVRDCRDPKDGYLLAMAQAGAADMLLTEDHDLLSLDPWQGVRIIRLHAFTAEFPAA